MTRLGLRFWSLYFLFLLPVALMAAEDLVVSNVGFQPQEFYVGDRVIMTVQLSAESNTEAVIPSLPFDNGQIMIEEIEVQANGDKYLLVIVFRSFVPGSVEFPRLDFGAFRLGGLSIYTTPLVEKPMELRSLRGQMLLPGTRLYSGLIILFVLLLPVLLLFLIRLIVRSGGFLFENYQRKKPYRRLIRVIKKLDSGLTQWDNKAFFIMLTDSLRDYLAGRTGLGFKTATTTEIRQLGRMVFPERELDKIVSLMSFGDRVKFGGEEVSGDSRRSSLDEVLRLAEDLEQQEAPHVEL